MANQDFLLDKRVLQRNLDKGVVDAKAVEKMLAALPDRADNVATTAYEAEVEDDLEDEDEDEDEG